MEKDDEYQEFYDACLKALKAHGNFNESYLPMLDRYVFITMKVAQLGAEIAEEEVVVEHTNKAEKTNTVTSPKWRMFMALDMQANLLAKNLRLSPATAPKSVKKMKAKGFDTEGKMKVA
jgi:hypothetical protein